MRTLSTGHSIAEMHGLEESVEKMRRAGATPLAIDSFSHYYRLLAEGETGLVAESEIEPAHDVPDAERLPEADDAEREALDRASLHPDSPRVEWAWPDDSTLDVPLWPLAHSAIDLLTNGPLERLAPCARCRWLFIDTSRNRSRRWCSMEECGTSVKKQRYVERRRARRRSSSRSSR
jgi:hypothetical protein